MKIQVVEIKPGIYAIRKVINFAIIKFHRWYDGIGSGWGVDSDFSSYSYKTENKQHAIDLALILSNHVVGKNVVWDSSKQSEKIKEVDKAFDITKRMIAAKNSGDDELEQILFMQLVEHNEKYLTQ